MREELIRTRGGSSDSEDMGYRPLGCQGKGCVEIGCPCGAWKKIVATLLAFSTVEALTN